MEKNPVISGIIAKYGDGPRVPYGTAGFRADATQLNRAMLVSGFLASFLSARDQAITGVSITASHNPANDNGVKLVNPHGHMMNAEDEALARELMQADDLCTVVSKLWQSVKENKSRVVIGYDTRVHSSRLASLVEEAVKSLGGHIVNLGLVSTPVVHWVVRDMNVNNVPADITPSIITDRYFAYYIDAISNFRQLVTEGEGQAYEERTVTCDAAGGVGGLMIGHLMNAFSALKIKVVLKNTPSTPGLELNANCGADYVQKEQKYPVNCHMNGDYFSLDGDADRLIYFTLSNGYMKLIDGDRQSALFAKIIVALIEDEPTSDTVNEPLRLGIVRTAYSSSGSSIYISQLMESTHRVKVETVWTKTGVKHLHKEAERFDIGIYFESNGHGTVLYKEERILQVLGQRNTEHVAKLLAYLRCFNQAVGDAIVNSLCFEAACRYLGWSPRDVINLYSDPTIIQKKVPLARDILDKLISHPQHEKYLIAPKSLQDEIDQAVSHVPHSRAFVRASGTEDVCRIYCEAGNQKDAEYLCETVVTILHKFMSP